MRKKGPRRGLEGHTFLDFARERAKKVCSLRGFARRREDCAVVLFEEPDPIGDVAGVPKLALDPEVSTEECCREFRDQLLGSVRIRAKAVLEIAIEAFLGRRLRTIRCWNQATTRRV